MIKKILLVVVLLASIYFSISSDLFGRNKKAGLQIEYPSGSASVFIDDQYLDKAPLINEDLNNGEHILKIVPDEQNLANFNIPIFLERGSLTVVLYNPGENPKNSSSVVFELAALKNNETAISIESYPENAFISLDQGEAQNAPFRIENPSVGEHHFSINLTDYKSQEHSFQVLEGYETKITVSLSKQGEIQEDLLEEVEPIKEEIMESSDSSQILGPKIQVKPSNYFVNQEEVVKVRDASSSSAQEIGLAKVKYFYPFLGEQSLDQKWLKIKFQNQEAWISSQYSQIFE